MSGPGHSQTPDTRMRHHDNNERLVTKVIMSTKSGSETEKLISVDEELKLFYKGAFDDFDWNKNGRIACGVIITSRQIKIRD